MSTTHAPELNGGTVTSWVPLTTAWPSDPSCSTAIYSQLGSAGKAIAYDPFYGSLIDRSLTCHPKAVSVWWKQGETPSLQTVQSLGPFKCAGDYSTAATSKVDDASTFVACCPSNYNFQFSTNFGQLGECVSTLSSGQAFTYMSILSIDNAEFREATTTIQSRTLVYAVQVNGYIFAEAVETKSLSSRSSSNSQQSTTLLTTGRNFLAFRAGITPAGGNPYSYRRVLIFTGTGTGTSTPGPTSSGGAVRESSSPIVLPSVTSTPDLSNGAKIGIGVGVGFGVLGLVALGLAFFFIRKHRKHHIDPISTPTTDKDVQAATWDSPVGEHSPNPGYGSSMYQTEPMGPPVRPSVGPEVRVSPGWGPQGVSEIGPGQQDRVFEIDSGQQDRVFEMGVDGKARYS